jgi:hypothetical protein
MRSARYGNFKRLEGLEAREIGMAGIVPRTHQMIKEIVPEDIRERLGMFKDRLRPSYPR